MTEGLPRADVRRPESGGKPSHVWLLGGALFVDNEDHALVQRRLALTYGLFGLIAAGFYVLFAAIILSFAPGRFVAVHVSVPKLAHLAALGFLLAAWLVCRGKPRPRWMLAAIDLVGCVKLVAIGSIGVALAPQGVRAELMHVMLFVLLMCLRAALVPSPPRWTTFVAVIAALPVPFAAYACVMRDSYWAAAVLPRSAILVIAAGWCVAGTIAAWAISRVVYGLRAEAKTAMRLGQYTLEDKIGEGGMGEVYRARHALLRRPTAIKLLSSDRTGTANVRRFEREVQLTSQLSHPNTIAIYDFGHTRRGVFYYAMEHIDGMSLQQLCEDHGPQPDGRVIHILAQVASALAEAHGVGLIHRDVKPANILLCERGGLSDFAKVLDFGLVKEIGVNDPALSVANAIAGTPMYMAPESITDPTAIDSRVDLYALGGVAYFLLAGRPPFDGNLIEVCSRHLHTPPTPPSERIGRTVLPGLEKLVLECLEKRPEDRPATSKDVARRLRALQPDCPWTDDDARSWWSERRSEKPRAHQATA